MALIDTEGRTVRERFGKGNAFTGDKKCGKLIFSDHGLAPQESHTGCSVESGNAGRKHLDTPGTNTTQDPQGKRYIVMEHQLYSDDRKRQQGKIGLKKLKPYVQESEKPRGKSGSEFTGMTSEQRASLNIQKITHQDPSQLGVTGRELFNYEEKVQRAERVRVATSQREEFSANQRVPKRQDPSQEMGFMKNSPFAVKGNEAVNQRKSALRRCEKPSSMGKVQQSKPQGRSVDPAKFKGVPTPFDTIDSQMPYPEPPSVGERVDPFSGRGKGCVTGTGQWQCSMDWDSVVRKRAEGRPNIAPAPRGENVIFGNPSPEQQRGLAASPQSNRGVGHSLLEHRVVPVSESRNVGVRMNGNQYKPTSLW